MKSILILCMVMSLAGVFPMVMLGVDYVELGQGLHPVLSWFGVSILLALGWSAACLFDSY